MIKNDWSELNSISYSYVCSPQLRCSRVPEKSQIYYNATNSGQRKPLSPGSISKSNDAAWWNIPIRNSLQSNDDIVPDQLLTSSDALFGSFQLYDKDPMSSLSSFVCPSCDVEGSSRYLLEYFELFHAMKKTFYSQYLTDDTPVRRDRMSECVESRTGEGILEYLVKVHATDCQLSGGGILRMCAASELNILHMANVRQFLSKQLPSDSPKQIEDCTSIVENNIANKKKREVDDRRTCTDENTSPKTSPSKKKIKMDFDAATAIHSKASRGVSNGQSSHGQNYPRPKEIYYHKSKNKYEVKAQGKKFLGIYNTYEEASYVLEVHNSSCDKNSPFTEDGNNKVERPAMLPLGVSPVKASQIDKAMLEVNEHGQVNIHSNDLELGALSSPKGTEGELHEKTSRGIYYNETMRRWQVFADDQTFIGAYQCYEDAIESLHSSNNTWINESPRESENISDDEHTANVSKKTSCTDPIISLNASSGEKTKDEAPTNHSGSQQQDKLDPSYLVGMSIMLFNPVDNSYHSGRIVDCRLNAPKADDSTIRYKSSIGRLLDDDISKAMYLIRFREGADGRKVAIHQWVYLEEHAVRVGGEVCWARISNEMKGKDYSSPYRPVQIIFRSMLEQISTLQNLEAGEEMKSNATTILANGFGNMFSFISITMDDNIINSLNHDSIEFAEPAENNHSDAATINDITKRPVIFPFRASDPLWLNQILRRVRLCDEEIGVACAMATAEQEACRLVRSGMKKA